MSQNPDVVALVFAVDEDGEQQFHAVASSVEVAKQVCVEDQEMHRANRARMAASAASNPMLGYDPIPEMNLIWEGQDRVVFTRGDSSLLWVQGYVIVTESVRS